MNDLNAYTLAQKIEMILIHVSLPSSHYVATGPN